jgi:hypothetical protein
MCSLYFSVPEYDIVHPTQVSAEGAFLTHDLTRQSIRERRDSSLSHADDIYFKLNAFGNNLHLKLQRNRRLLAPDFHVEVLGQGGRIIKRHTLENCHWTGKVGTKSLSSVAVSNCHGLVSSRTFDRTFHAPNLFKSKKAA